MAETIRDRIVGLERIRAGDLLVNRKNWRKHPKAQQDAMRGVLTEIGYADALLAYSTEDGLTLVDGHLRASLDPDQIVPVLILDIDQEEADKLLATLDPLAGMAMMDATAFGELVSDLTFDAPAIADMISSVAANAPAVSPTPLPPSPEDEADEQRTAALGNAVAQPDYQPFTKRGQVWQLGRHRLFCDEAPGPLLGCDLKEALVLTDPPYGINIVKGLSPADSGGAKPFGRVLQPGGRTVGVNSGHANGTPKKNGFEVKALRGHFGSATSGYGNPKGHINSAVSTAHRDKFPGQVGKPGLVQPRLYYPVTNDDKPFDPTWLLSIGKAQIIFGAPYFASKLRDGTAWIAWDKGISSESSFSGFEAAWTSFPGHFRLYRHVWSGMVRQGNRKDELVDRVHPTQKPVGLLAAILQDRPGFQIVVDPYIGSGSTLIACEKLGRTCYGVEIEPHYCDVIIKRWEQYTGAKAQLIEGHPP